MMFRERKVARKLEFGEQDVNAGSQVDLGAAQEHVGKKSPGKTQAPQV